MKMLKWLPLSACLWSGVLFAQSAPPPTAPSSPRVSGDTKASLGVRVDCLHDFNLDKGAAQNCLTISSLKVTVVHQDSAKVRAMLRLDPFATPRSSDADTPDRVNGPAAKDTELGIIDAYALTWLPRPNLDVSVGSYDGAARIPSTSGLAMAGRFADNGWKQTALTVTYNLSVPTEMRVRFAAGNGEGEPVKNLDPQQYFGFDADARIIKGMHATLGVSLDGNDAGSEEHDYLSKKYQQDCALDPTKAMSKLGHSTQRIAAGLALDGTLTGVEGLKVGLGWQRNVLSDLDKKHRGAPSDADLKNCPRLDVDTVFVEDSGDAVNTVQRTNYAFNLNYRLWTAYFIAFDYETRRVDTGSEKLFEVCRGYTNGKCSAPSGDERNNLSEDAFTAGAGMDLESDLKLTVEYSKEKFDRTFTQVFFDNQNGKVATQREVFNARLAYNIP